MQKVINVCSRVEGHGKVNYFIQNEKIDHVEFEISAFRGFENILVGKKLNDIPRIVSRICGLCHASQTFASCKAIEKIYEIQPSFQTTLLRRILMVAELIKSHIMHFFFQSLPDFLEIFQIYKKGIDPYQLIRFDSQLTTSVYDLIKAGSELNNIFGGRMLHLITPIPGGIIYNPSKKNILLAQKYLQKSIFNIQYIIDKFVELFATKIPPNEFNLQNPSYFGMSNKGKYDRYNGTLNIMPFNMKKLEFEVNGYLNYFDKDCNLFGIKFRSKDFKNILTGPIARFHLVENDFGNRKNSIIDNFEKNWRESILFMNVLQLIEIFKEIEASLEILNQHSLENKEPLPSLNSIVHQNGVGMVEAPRGTLIHHYHMNKSNNIDYVKLFIATEINFPLLNEKIKNYAQELYKKEDLESVNRKVQILIRAFDPCISCATH
ncbi:MAG: nickel-dependent hydrogenase large subunit [Candidatus Hodarchaeota archaeon]